MPLYMDRHEPLEGQVISPRDVAEAHLKDLEVQEKYGVRYINYWFDYDRQTVFCLAEAPNREAAEAVHKEAHGLMPSKILEVDPRSVELFLGAIEEAKPGVPISEPGIRTILFTDMEGSTSLTEQLGDRRAAELRRTHDELIRTPVRAGQGHEIKHTGDGIMACFASVVRALESSIQIQEGFEGHNATAEVPLRVRIGLSAGEPVTEQDDLYGLAVNLAARVCGLCDPGAVLASNIVRDLALGKDFKWEDKGEAKLRGFDQPVRLYQLIGK